MMTERNISFNDNISKIISMVFHPLFIPLYGLLIIFTAPTLFWYLPLKVKEILLLLLVVNNVIIPFLIMLLLRYNKLISEWAIKNGKERVLPLLSVLLLYSISSFILFRFPIPVFVKYFIFSISFLVLIVTIINFWWKISLYSAGAGILAGIVIVLSFKMAVPLTWFLIPVILAGGLVLASRLKLNLHSSSEVYFGFLTGFFGMVLFMFLF